ncbi:hypothetical protein DACRYDRAFT_53554, partial [Dacryopinax primogenitus]
RTLPNLVADKVGIFPVFIPCLIIAGAIVFAMFAISSIPAVVIFCLLYGFFSGAYISLLGPMFAAMADHPSEMGARMGFAFALVGVAALIGTPIDGALVGSGPEYEWWKAIVFSAVGYVRATHLIVAYHALIRLSCWSDAHLGSLEVSCSRRSGETMGLTYGSYLMMLKSNIFH